MVSHGLCIIIYLYIYIYTSGPPLYTNAGSTTQGSLTSLSPWEADRQTGCTHSPPGDCSERPGYDVTVDLSLLYKWRFSDVKFHRCAFCGSVGPTLLQKCQFNWWRSHWRVFSQHWVCTKFRESAEIPCRVHCRPQMVILHGYTHLRRQHPAWMESVDSLAYVGGGHGLI